MPIAWRQRNAALLLFIAAHPNNVPNSLSQMLGEWELISPRSCTEFFSQFSFSSPFNKPLKITRKPTSFGGVPKAELFFKLHELQTVGASKTVAWQNHITANNLYSEFDTSLFGLTVSPIVGWFAATHLGGCNVTLPRRI
jgi:hypothetical protein